jgi:hypothetical protein
MFTIDELSIIKMYCGFSQNRDSVIAALNDSLPLIEDQNIKSIVEETIRKVTAMTQAAFSDLDLSDTLLSDE